MSECECAGGSVMSGGVSEEGGWGGHGGVRE